MKPEDREKPAVSITAERKRSIASGLDAALNEVGRIPGELERRRVHRLDDVQDALRQVAVDVLFVLVDENDARALRSAGQCSHPLDDCAPRFLGGLSFEVEGVSHTPRTSMWEAPN